MFDQGNVFDLFFRDFDESFFEGMVKNYTIQPRAFEKYCFLGEGYHFKSWKFNYKTQELVIKIANKNFLRDRSSSQISDWVKLIQNINQLQLPFCLPQAVIQFQKEIAIVMPFGTYIRVDPQTAMEVTKVLQFHGLRIADHLQLVLHHQKKYICDYSDLKKI